jgi:transposase
MRKRYSVTFKAQIVLELLKEEKTVYQPAAQRLPLPVAKHPVWSLPEGCEGGWWEKLEGMERFQLELDLETKQYLQGQIERITEELGRMSHAEPWAGQMLYLMQIPGFGVVTGMTVLAAIGDIGRFESPKRLASYSGRFYFENMHINRFTSTFKFKSAFFSV